MSKYLFDNLSYVKERIENSKNIMLFLDYDGTLADFNKDSMKALPSEEIKQLLKTLIEKPEIKPIIVTGRNKERIRKLLDLKGLEYVCSHGFEMDYSDFELNISDDDKKTINDIFRHVKEEFSDKIKDMNMKGDIGINFNYRPYNGDCREIKRKFIEIVKRYDVNKRLRIMKLSKAINVIPKSWNKGKAVEFILEKHTTKGTLPFFFGDDFTDEDAFNVLKDTGITIYVKNDEKRESKAEFFVNNPDEVLRALETLFNKTIGK